MPVLLHGEFLHKKGDEMSERGASQARRPVRVRARARVRVRLKPTKSPCDPSFENKIKYACSAATSVGTVLHNSKKQKKKKNLPVSSHTLCGLSLSLSPEFPHLPNTNSLVAT